MNVRAQINFWMSLKQSNYDKLAEEMTKRTAKKYTRGSINAKLYRDTLSVNEFVLIADILGYKIDFKEL